MWRRIPLIGIIALLWWVSFVPEPVQLQYRNITSAALVILLFISIFAQKSRLRRLLFEKQDILLWLYLLAVIICGVFLAKERYQSLIWFYRVILPVPFLYLLAKNEINKMSGSLIAKSLCLFSSIVALIGLAEFIFRGNFIYDYFTYNPYYYRFLYLQHRMMTTLVHPAVAGSYLLVSLPFSFLLVSTKNRLLKWLGILCVTPIISGIILTFSRGTLFGMFVLLWVYFWRKNRKLFIKIFIIGAFSLFILSSILGKGSSLQRFGFNGLTNKSLYQYRIVRLCVTYKMLRDHPFSGLGLNHYRILFDKYYGSPEVPFEWKIPDDAYLSILGETGTIGFFTFIIFMGFLLKNAFRYFYSINDKDTKNLLIAIIAGIIGLMVNFLTYDTLYWQTPLYLFWILVGMVSGLIATRQQRPLNEYA